MTDKGKLMSVKEVIGYLDISRITLYRLIKNGDLAGHKIGGLWRFTEEDVETYLEKTRITGRTRYPGQVFYTLVLSKYYQAPHKYQVIRKGVYWWLSLRDDYLARLPDQKRTGQNFRAVRLRKIRLPDIGTAILVSSRYFDRLLEEDQADWLKAEIKTS